MAAGFGYDGCAPTATAWCTPLSHCVAPRSCALRSSGQTAAQPGTRARPEPQILWVSLRRSARLGARARGLLGSRAALVLTPSLPDAMFLAEQWRNRTARNLRAHGAQLPAPHARRGRRIRRRRRPRLGGGIRDRAGVRLDARALADFMDAGQPRLHTLAEIAARFGDPLPFAVLSAGVLALAFRRGGVRLAGMVGAVLVGAGITTQVLKPLTADPRGIDLVPSANVSNAAWPSGHATAAAALAFCLVALAPARWRPLAIAAGAAFALAVGCSVLVLGWHFPSDVAGGVCVAAAWTLCGLAVVYPRPM